MHNLLRHQLEEQGISPDDNDVIPERMRALIAAIDATYTEVFTAYNETLSELATPVIPIVAGIIVMPLVGAVDSLRARDVTRALLAGISTYQAQIVILDVTGVPIVDSGVAAHLDKTIQAARLKGARAIVTGISYDVAETIVDLGIQFNDTTTLSTLQVGLMQALNWLGYALVKQ